MNGDGLGDGKFLHRFGENAFPFLLRENGMVGVAELGDVAAFVMIADEAFKNDESSTGRILHFLTEGGDVEGGVLNGKHDGLASGERGHEGDGLSRGKKIRPVGEFVINGGVHVREIK